MTIFSCGDNNTKSDSSIVVVLDVKRIKAYTCEAKKLDAGGGKRKRAIVRVDAFELKYTAGNSTARNINRKAGPASTGFRWHLKAGLPEIRRMNGIRLRPATVADAADLLAIYKPYIESTAITFEEEVPSVEAFATRISNCLLRYPWIVAEDASGRIAGYAYAASYNERAAYQWACLSSVYLADDYKGKGLARPLYEALFALLRAQGYRSVFALITLPNAPSIGLHERCGFRYFTTFDNIGFKLGSWHQVGWWRLDFSDFTDTPLAPVPFDRFPSASVARILADA